MFSTVNQTILSVTDLETPASSALHPTLTFSNSIVYPSTQPTFEFTESSLANSTSAFISTIPLTTTHRQFSGDSVLSFILPEATLDMPSLSVEPSNYKTVNCNSGFNGDDFITGAFSNYMGSLVDEYQFGQYRASSPAGSSQYTDPELESIFGNVSMNSNNTNNAANVKTHDIISVDEVFHPQNFQVENINTAVPKFTAVSSHLSTNVAAASEITKSSSSSSKKPAKRKSYKGIHVDIDNNPIPDARSLLTDPTMSKKDKNKISATIYRKKRKVDQATQEKAFVEVREENSKLKEQIEGMKEEMQRMRNSTNNTDHSYGNLHGKVNALDLAEKNFKVEERMTNFNEECSMMGSHTSQCHSENMNSKYTVSDTWYQSEIPSSGAVTEFFFTMLNLFLHSSNEVISNSSLKNTVDRYTDSKAFQESLTSLLPSHFALPENLTSSELARLKTNIQTRLGAAGTEPLIKLQSSSPEYKRFVLSQVYLKVCSLVGPSNCAEIWQNFPMLYQVA